MNTSSNKGNEMAGKKDKKNILDLIPVRNYKWEEKENISVIVPRFRSRLGKWICKFLKKDPHYRINLDERSSLAWKLSNGKRTVLDIAKELEKKFKGKWP
jgi:hypothetical protein